MSRWLPDRLEIVLAPDHLRLARSPHPLHLRGRSRSTGPAALVPVARPEGEASAWAGALAALGDRLQDLEAHGMVHGAATVVLANRYIHYALVPWSDLIDDEAEGLALARHHLRENFGAAAERWELRVAPDGEAPQRLVSAVEPDLLDGLRAVFARRAVRLASIQPRLMTLCNAHRRQLGRRDAWLAMAEPGALCLALLQGGHIVRLRQLRLGDAWPEELVTALERESYLADAAVPVRDVFLAADGMEDRVFPPGGSWNIRRIEASPAVVAPAAAAGGVAAAGG